MRKYLLLLPIFAIACRSSYITEIPQETKISTSLRTGGTHKIVVFVEDDAYYKVAQKNLSYKEAKEAITAQLPAASSDCLCGITVHGGIIRIDGEKKSWIIDIKKLPTIAGLVLYDGKNKPIVELNPKKYEMRFRKMFRQNLK